MSFCSGTGSFGVMFDAHVTRFLNDGWFEAEYGHLNSEQQFYSNPPAVGRFNLARVCYVKPIAPK